MAEFFPHGNKRMFPHKVVVPCACERVHPQHNPPGTTLLELSEYAEGIELGGRFKFGTVRPAPRSKSLDCEVPVFFTDVRAALAFKMRFC